MKCIQPQQLMHWRWDSAVALLWLHETYNLMTKLPWGGWCSARCDISFCSVLLYSCLGSQTLGCCFSVADDGFKTTMARSDVGAGWVVVRADCCFGLSAGSPGCRGSPGSPTGMLESGVCIQGASANWGSAAVEGASAVFSFCWQCCRYVCLRSLSVETSAALSGWSLFYYMSPSSEWLLLLNQKLFKRVVHF